jgi:hypothetical protein
LVKTGVPSMEPIESLNKPPGNLFPTRENMRKVQKNDDTKQNTNANHKRRDRNRARQ